MYQATLESEKDESNEAYSLVQKPKEAVGACRRQGRAASKIPYRVRDNIEHLIKRFNEVPVLNIFGLYGRMFGEVLDAEEYGFDYGILELVGTMNDTVEVYDNGSTLICRPLSNRFGLANGKSTNIKTKWSANLKAALNGTHFWNTEERKYFDSNGPKIIIDPPPVASLFIRNEASATEEFNRIFNLLEANPFGIPLLQFDKMYFKKYKRNLNLLYFNFASLCELVNACPEIFYAKSTQSDDLILYDGRYNTFSDLEGKNLIASQVEQYMTYLLEGHIVQKTLLIVDTAKPNGLPVNIYLKTLQANFKLDEKMSLYLEKLTAITILRMMAKLNLVKLKSAPECANDVRVFLTKNFDYGSWAMHFQDNLAIN